MNIFSNHEISFKLYDWAIIYYICFAHQIRETVSAIFGIIHFNEKPVEYSTLLAMQQSLDYWGRDGKYLWNGNNIALGQMQLFSTPESVHETYPYVNSEAGLVLVAACRLDNRLDLFRKLNIINHLQTSVTDAELILKAYLKWKQHCVQHLLGDWSFAIYNTREKNLFLARDHKGISSLYYSFFNNTLAFSSSQKALLALPFVNKEINEHKLVDMVLRYNLDDERTCFNSIKRLPPAHCINVSSNVLKKECFWKPEDVSENIIESHNIQDQLHYLFKESVQCRLRNIGSVASTLSAGFDSMAVTAFSASLLQEKLIKLPAYTSVPAYETASSLRCNEGTQASKVASCFNNIEHVLVNSRNVSVSESIRKSVETYCYPVIAPTNQHWLHDIYSQVHEKGANCLLVAQGGNGTISFPNSNYYKKIQPSWLQIVLLSNYQNIYLSSLSPKWVLNFYKRIRLQKFSEINNSCFNIGYLHENGYMANYKQTHYHAVNELKYRLNVIQPQGINGELKNELAALYGITIADPTDDLRLLEFSIALSKRNLISRKPIETRDAMQHILKYYLPEEIIQQNFVGKQASDMAARLINEKDAIIENLKYRNANHLIDIKKIISNFTALKPNEPDQVKLRQILNAINIASFIDSFTT